MSYDPKAAARFYDAYGELEWTRFADGRTSAISFYVHRHYLERFVRQGELVLDAGAGPGRFTIELARLGARVVVADLSPGQLALNRVKVDEAGFAANVVDRVVADIVDLGQFSDASFDAVVCFGGPLSYVMERADGAVAELLRVTKPGGRLLLSVMSLVGAASLNLAQVVDDAKRLGFAATDDIIRTGNLPSPLSGGHLVMHMFRWSELRHLLERHPCTIVAASAASIGVPQDQAIVESLGADQLDALVRWEIDLGAEPGAISSGAHMIAVVQKNGDS